MYMRVPSSAEGMLHHEHDVLVVLILRMVLWTLSRVAQIHHPVDVDSGNLEIMIHPAACTHDVLAW